MPSKPFSLMDKYTQDTGRIFITGTQALVRLPLVQKRLDVMHSRRTSGFISGYRGSPLAGFDMALWRAQKNLKENGIVFQPGINEDLAATAVWGTQQVHLSPQSTVDGVFSMWYSKGPGVDRSGDVLKHANAAGTSRWGGVLALIGDDHACKSSTLPHQSEFALLDAGIPIIHPATVQDILDFGILGWGLSRYAGVWVAFKMVSETVDTTASVDVGLERYQIQEPPLPEDVYKALHLRWPDPPIAQEARLYDQKRQAIQAYIHHNELDQVIWESRRPRIGLIAVGKAYNDLRQALADIGIDEERAQELGINLYKVVVSWPLAEQKIKDFCQNLEEVIVFEEKRPLIEEQLKTLLYHLPATMRPRISGKRTSEGSILLPETYELTPYLIARSLAQCFSGKLGFESLQDVLTNILNPKETNGSLPPILSRPPYYCSGCPHNRSTTQLPDGSRALAGIGCHYMATWIDHRTQTFAQMGGEGVPWIGTAPFTDEAHIFANLGDGTYYHSGILAIRSTVAARVNITFKILYNDAVAMTGGQPVDGPLTVQDIAQQMAAEGVKKICVVVDDLTKYPRDIIWPAQVTVHARQDLQLVQEQLKATPGTTVLIYDQTCAAEQRRRRKRGLAVDPPRRIFIHEEVCEGCGDCSQKSNCLSVVPVETEWGTKRTIDQSSCNKDYSCVEGFCPSFVSVIGGGMRKPEVIHEPLPMDLPEPVTISLEEPYNIFIAGIGGTGVVTVGALIATAAHLEGKGCTVVDMAGLAQKGGSVTSHVRIAKNPEDIHTPNLGQGAAHLLFGCDLVVTTHADNLQKISPQRTHVMVNDHQSITGDFIKNPDYVFPESQLRQRLEEYAGADYVNYIKLQECATTLLGNSIMSNVMMVGFAAQKGWLPVAIATLEQAIRLNQVSVEDNLSALQWGRKLAHAPDQVLNFIRQMVPATPNHERSQTIQESIARRVQFLKHYQNARHATSYQVLMDNILKRDQELEQETLSWLVAQSLYRVMSYKDEYEVARLYTRPEFKQRLAQQFTGTYRLKIHLAPPLLSRRDPRTGHLKKRTFGAWILPVFRILATFKFLRGTPLDIFGYTQERRQERQLMKFVMAFCRDLPHTLTHDNYDQACEFMRVLQKIRGFGHVKEQNHGTHWKKIETLAQTFTRSEIPR